MERSKTIAEAENYWASRTHTKTAGWNTAVSMPSDQTRADDPSVTFETDSFGWAIRKPADFTPNDPYAILTTNTFFKYHGAFPPAVEITHTYQPALQHSNYRYLAMLELMDRFRQQGRTVGTPGAAPPHR